MTTTASIPFDRHEFRASPRRVAVGVRAESETSGSLIDKMLLPMFSFSLFFSAALLFLVQPMVGKMILPMLGGTPAVWNACMLFFQAMLLAGYAYAHLTTTWLGVRWQAAMHLVVVLAPLLLLPIVVGDVAPPGGDTNPVFWLLGRLFLAVGAPFFVVATTGPLLQRWFASTGHATSHDPFFLYAASNAGSLLALLGYPLLLEPAMTLRGQSELWSSLYWVFMAAVAGCAMLLWMSRSHAAVAAKFGSRRTKEVVDDLRDAATKLTASRRLWWILASFVGSTLMLGVTAHITSNLAPVPLLWVLPLAIYLLTFILVFAKSRPIPHELMTKLLPFLLLPLALVTFLELPRYGWVAIIAHLVVFFVAAMVCHGTLADSRPHAKHLTEFYLWLSVGGVLGGIFNALVAPMVFSTIVEYPLALMLACLFLPRPAPTKNGVNITHAYVIPLVVMGILSLLAIVIVRVGAWGDSLGMRATVFAPLALLCFGFKDRPMRFAVGLGIYMVALGAYRETHRGAMLEVSRNFFGVKRVTVDPTGTFRVLVHGGTTHGKEFVDPSRAGEPLTYYHRSGPLGDIFRTANKIARPTDIAAIGLGAGSIASYVEPGQSLTFYEIDPDVARIALNPAYFTFLMNCRGECDIVLGDGRLSIGAVDDNNYGLIVLDAFSSDAIPTHLVTREALQLYLSKLAPGGLLAFHISNRYLDLEPLIAVLARDAGLTGYVRSDLELSEDDKAGGKTPAIWAVLARGEAALGELPENSQWKPLPLGVTRPVWTDQYTSILSYVVWR